MRRALTLCVALVGAVSAKAPEWVVQGSHRSYPAELYVVGVGISSQGLDAARQAAMADVARQMKSRVKSEMVDEQWERAFGQKRETGEFGSASTTVRTSLEVPGIAVVETAQDGGESFALAVLDRGRFASQARLRIDELARQAAEQIAAARMLSGEGKLPEAFAQIGNAETAIARILDLRAMIAMVGEVGEKDRLPFSRADFDAVYRAAVDGLRVDKVSGDSQTIDAGAAWGDPLAIRVSVAGKPVAGVEVRFTGGSGRLAGAAWTGADGVASLRPAWSGDLEPGERRLTARLVLPVPGDLMSRLRTLERAFTVFVAAPSARAAFVLEIPDGWNSPLVRERWRKRAARLGLAEDPAARDSVVVRVVPEEKGVVQGIGEPMIRVRATVDLELRRKGQIVARAAGTATGIARGRPEALAQALGEASFPAEQIRALAGGDKGGRTAPRLAIILLENSDFPGEWAGASDELRRMLVAELVRRRSPVLDRAAVDSVLAGARLSLASIGRDDLDRVRALGADRLLLGSLSVVGGRLESDFRLVDVGSARVLESASRSCATAEVMRGAVPALVEDLAPASR